MSLIKELERLAQDTTLDLNKELTTARQQQIDHYMSSFTPMNATLIITEPEPPTPQPDPDRDHEPEKEVIA
tara:strand:- start:131 stop:343 length:213 start_codon:yes stop_codon:yes gene_type:complete